MLSIGHRGAMGYAPENTLMSIRKAIELGADWVEIDVHFAHDELWVIHDETLDRTTNGSGEMSAYSYEQLRTFDAGEGEIIPTLQEVIDLTKGTVGLNIELKSKGCAVKVTDMLRALSVNHREKIIISSFLLEELTEVFNLDKTLKIGVLVGRNIEKSFTVAKALNACSMHFSFNTISQNLVDRGHAQSFLVFVYTVNKQSDLHKMKLLGVDGVFSNFPDLVLNI